MYKEIMMNDDNLESNLLTFSLLKMCSLLQVEPEICVEVSAAEELLIFYMNSGKLIIQQE